MSEPKIDLGRYAGTYSGTKEDRLDRLVETCTLFEGPNIYLGDDQLDALSFIKARPAVGCWVVSDSWRVYVCKAPTRWQRWMTKLLLGWVWEAL